MKKTLTVNLNNIVFHIDDDAYEMLQTYLHEIAEHLSEDERKDILNDIEARIAELFNEKLQKNKNVINLIDVQEIIEIMGKPSQYTGEDDEEEQKKYRTIGLIIWLFIGCLPLLTMAVINILDKSGVW